MRRRVVAYAGACRQASRDKVAAPLALTLLLVVLIALTGCRGAGQGSESTGQATEPATAEQPPAETEEERRLREEEQRAADEYYAQQQQVAADLAATSGI